MRGGQEAGNWTGEEGDRRGWNERGGKRRGLKRMSEILKNANCRTDLIGGEATQTFAPGGKDPHVAID